MTSPASADRPGEDSGSGKDTVDSHFMYYAMNEHTSDDVFEPAEDAEKITFIRLKLPGDAKESATGPDKSPSRPLRRASTPDHASFIVIQCQTVPVPRAKYVEVTEKIRDNVTDGLYEFAAEKIEEPGWSQLTRQWVTADPGDFGVAAQEVQDFQDTLKRVLVGDPIGRIASGAGLPDPALLGDLASNVSIVIIDGPLNKAEQCIAIAGIIIGTFAGVPVLACASFKYLAHKMLRQALAEALESAVKDLWHGAAPQRESLSTRYPNRLPPSADPRRLGTAPRPTSGPADPRRTGTAPRPTSGPADPRRTGTAPPPTSGPADPRRLGTAPQPRPGPTGPQAPERKNPGRGI